MKFYQSRPFPDGFAIRKTTVCKKVDGWYISVCLQDNTVPDAPQSEEIKTAVGVDVGIKKLASLSNGELVANPRFYARQEKKRKRLSRAVQGKQKGSNKRRKAYERIARLEQKVANQREDYQWKIAHKLARYDLVVFEALNVKNMMKRCKPKFDEEQQRYVKNGQAAKSGLNKAIQDASWYSLRQKVRVVAERYGVLVHEINPRHTSQECSACGYISPKNRDGEKFLCESCGHIADADIDAAVVILQRGLSELGISLGAVPGDTRKQDKSTPTEISTGLLVEPGNCQKIEFKTLEGVQLSLFDWMAVYAHGIPTFF